MSNLGEGDGPGGWVGQGTGYVEGRVGLRGFQTMQPSVDTL
jgi:hypothetical protein